MIYYSSPLEQSRSLSENVSYWYSQVQSQHLPALVCQKNFVQKKWRQSFSSNKQTLGISLNKKTLRHTEFKNRKKCVRGFMTVLWWDGFLYMTRFHSFEMSQSTSSSQE